jgi:hypothetical protein
MLLIFDSFLSFLDHQSGDDVSFYSGFISVIYLPQEWQTIQRLLLLSVVEQVFTGLQDLICYFVVYCLLSLGINHFASLGEYSEK